MGIKKEVGEIAYKALVPKDDFEYVLIAGTGIGVGSSHGDPILGIGYALGLYGGLRLYKGIKYGVDYLMNRKEE